MNRMIYTRSRTSSIISAIGILLIVAIVVSLSLLIMEVLK